MIVLITHSGPDTYTAQISNPPIVLKYSIKNEGSNYTVKQIEPDED